MTDLSSQISLITSKLNEQLAALESEYQRWSVYKTDYDALENQLKTLPDTTTQNAMVRNIAWTCIQESNYIQSVHNNRFL